MLTSSKVLKTPFLISQYLKIMKLEFLDDPDELSPFTLVDSEGNPVVGGDLGLLLYKGGTVCENNFDYTSAYAICRKMGYSSATGWISGHRFDIQHGFDVKLNNVECSTGVWETCTFSQAYRCWHDSDVFLSCTIEGSTDTKRK